jgi:hypothetical protein
MNTLRTDHSLTVQDNFNLYRQSIRHMFAELDEEDQIDYEDRAKSMADEGNANEQSVFE